jgi:hypothetical protein
MARPTLADLGPTARHILGMSKRSQGVSAAEVQNTCFLAREEAEKRLAGLARLGHVKPIGRGRYVDAARIVAPPTVKPAPVAAPVAPAPARAAPVLAPIGASVRGEPARSRGGPASWRPARQQLLAEPAGVAPPVTIKPARPAPAEPVIPPTVKVTVCPSPAPYGRYQVDPSARPFGAGFSAAGIGRDLTTGQAWGSPIAGPDQSPTTSERS